MRSSGTYSVWTPTQMMTMTWTKNTIPSTGGDDADGEDYFIPQPAYTDIDDDDAFTGFVNSTELYRTVGETVGLTTKKVKEVADAMIKLAAEQLKSGGAFKIAGAIKLKLKNNKTHRAARPGVDTNQAQTVRVTPMKKFKKMVGDYSHILSAD